MADTNQETHKKSRRPRMRKRTLRDHRIPRASMPPQVRPIFSRPTAASPTQRKRRSALRHEGRAGTITASIIDATEGELMLYGTIGADFWGNGVTAEDFDAAMKELGNVERIRLRINSGGGDVFEATAIYDMLVKAEQYVIVEIEGVAASAAPLIAMAGDEIRISENAHFMVHEASGLAFGKVKEIRDYVLLLDNANELMRLTFSRRTGISDSELMAMMDHDNWMTAAQALGLGFVDQLDEAKSVKPDITPDQPANLAARRRRLVTSSDLVVMRERLAAFAATIAPDARVALMRPAANATHTGGSPQTVTPTPKDKKKMNAKLRAKCIEAGMPDSASDEEAEKWFEEHADNVFKAKAPEPPKQPEKPPVVSDNLDTVLDAIDAKLDAREKKRADAIAAFRAECDASLQLAFGDTIPDGLKAKCYEMSSEGVTAVRKAIIEAKASADDNVPTGGVRLSAVQPRDRHLAAIKAGVMVRAFANFANTEPKLMQQDDGSWIRRMISPAQLLEKHLPEKDRPKDWQAFSRMHLVDIARECLIVDGVSRERVRALSPAQVAMAALGDFYQAGLVASALHTTGSLQYVTLDAMNKSLSAGYEEAPQTWRGPMRQGASVPDFKEKHVVKLSAAGNLPIWQDGLAPEEAKLSNEREKYAVEARSETLSFSWQLVVNDDMDALSRRPQLLGAAAGRTVNAVAWRQVTSNPTMADGQVLFLETAAGNRKRSNLTTGSASPSNTTIGGMRAKMRLMRGLNTPEGNESEDVLNIIPVYIIGPATLEGTILKEVNSTADPAASGNSAVFNTSRGLIPVIEPLLDASSTTAFYLSASPSQVDTIEVTFMQGFETPMLRSWMDEETMSQKAAVIQVFNAKAIDHRGFQKHNGA